jgi:hypothetical protein
LTAKEPCAIVLDGRLRRALAKATRVVRRGIAEERGLSGALQAWQIRQVVFFTVGGACWFGRVDG